MLIKAEAEKMDREWASIMDMENKQAVDRARNMQLAQDPRFRAINSQLLLSNVLYVIASKPGARFADPKKSDQAHLRRNK